MGIDSIDQLLRREIEARIVGQLIDALVLEFGREPVYKVIKNTIIRIAGEQGAQFADQAGSNSLRHFMSVLEIWKKGGALEMEILEQADNKLSFNVTRCRYAELYRELGFTPELGYMLSCNRDFALIKGFNKDITLRRTQTIMEGAPYCDFRFTAANAPALCIQRFSVSANCREQSQLLHFDNCARFQAFRRTI